VLLHTVLALLTGCTQY